MTGLQEFDAVTAAWLFSFHFCMENLLLLADDKIMMRLFAVPLLRSGFNTIVVTGFLLVPLLQAVCTL